MKMIYYGARLGRCQAKGGGGGLKSRVWQMVPVYYSARRRAVVESWVTHMHQVVIVLLVFFKLLGSAQ